MGPAAAPALDRIRRDGFAVLKDVLPPAHLGRVEAELGDCFAAAPFSVGLFNGFRTKRFQGLLKRSAASAELALNDAALGLAKALLEPFCDHLQLNLMQAIEIHPGELAQIPHRDDAMWPTPKYGAEYMVNVMWPLTAYSPENGGTRVWPGSHADRDSRPEEAEASVPEIGPGDALLFLGSCLHGAGAHRGSTVRRGILVSYCLGWLKPFENMWLTYPPEVARAFPPALRDLVGYRRHRPNLGNYEGQCPSVLFDDAVPDLLAAVDAVTPAQQDALASFAARQAAAPGLAA